MFFFISLVAKRVARLTRSCWKGRGKKKSCFFFFSPKAGRSEQTTRQLSVYSSVSACFNPHMAAACYLHWCSSLHLASAACQFSWSCFYTWACFFPFFSCILDTLFSQPELDIVLPAYVPAGNDWLWQKRYLSPSLKKKMGVGGSDGLSDSCHLPLVTLQPHHVILFLSIYVLHIYFLLLSQVM